MSTIEFTDVVPPKGRARVLALGGIATCGLVTAALFGLVLGSGNHPFKGSDVVISADVEVLPVPELRPGRTAGEDMMAVGQELSRISPAATASGRDISAPESGARITPARAPRRDGESVGALLVRFEQAGYQLAAVRDDDRHVPRLYVDVLPTDLADMASPKERKRVFIAAMLPLVLRVNEEILADRERVLALKSQPDTGIMLSAEDDAWLHAVADRYEAGPYDFAELLKRMDVVPPSLALAQAAEESGWGTSRFAQEGNALFGQYTFNEGAGMQPLERDANRRHFIKVYASLVDTVRSYMHNLNYHRAYREFRDRRADLRDAGRAPEGLVLVQELKRYSERGAAYIRTIRQIIRANGLDRLDDARLQGEQWTGIEPEGRGQAS